jgi:hypothetical protein
LPLRTRVLGSHFRQLRGARRRSHSRCAFQSSHSYAFRTTPPAACSSRFPYVVPVPVTYCFRISAERAGASCYGVADLRAVYAFSFSVLPDLWGPVASRPRQRRSDGVGHCVTFRPRWDTDPGMWARSHSPVSDRVLPPVWDYPERRVALWGDSVSEQNSKDGQ